jgi:lysophospholipase L1-like esterase
MNLLNRLSQRRLLVPSRMRRAMTHDGQFMPKLNAGGTAWQDQDWETTAAGILVRNTAMDGLIYIAGFGDSITARSVFAGSTQIGYNSGAGGYLGWVQALCYGRIWMPLVGTIDTAAAMTKQVDWCKGVSGETTSDMLLRLGDVINLSPRPKMVFFLGGTNDLTVAATRGDSALVMFNRWKTIVNAFLAAGIIVVCLTILPRGQVAGGAPGSRPGWSTLSDAEIITARGKLNDFNSYIRAFCANTNNTILVDPWARLVDWTSTTGDALSSLTDLNDFLHPNDLACYYIGDECRIALANSYLAINEVSAFMGSGDAYDVTNQPYGSMNDGSHAVGTAGTATAPFSAGAGGVPTLWTYNKLSGTGTGDSAVVQKQLRSDGRPGWESNIVYAGPSAVAANQYRGYWNGSVINAANFVAGDAWQASCEVTVVSSSGAFMAPDLYVRQNTGNVYALKRSTVDVPGAYKMWLRTPIIIQPAAVSALNFWTLDQVGIGGAATVNRRNMQLRKYNKAVAGALAF